jgi:thiol-disulfide isomerase/thioredoxin
MGLGVVLIVCVWFLREPLRRQVFTRALLANEAPTDEAVQELIESAPDPRAAVLAAWNTGKISHRLLALQKLSNVVGHDQPWSAPLRQMVLAAALDPDLDARELALGALDDRNDPALAALSATQLIDIDPQVRLLGLTHLKKLPAEKGIPLVAPLLNDTNPQILAYTLKLLEDWSGEKFGVKLADAVPFEDGKTGLTVFDDASYGKTRAAADTASKWWGGHKASFHQAALEIPPEALAALKPLYASDFTLTDTDGKSVRLSDLRGKVVLLNFWATWCTACLSELPELIALQKNHHDELAILGVSMDFVPDEDNPQAPSSPEAIHQKIARTVQQRGINYPVLMDTKNTVGGRFNGGELPTTVIIDAKGRIRRRFVGTRSLPVFEAMIAEASKPMPPMQMVQDSSAK